MIHKDQTPCLNSFTFVLKTGLGSEQFCPKFQILIPKNKPLHDYRAIWKMEIPANVIGVCSSLWEGLLLLQRTDTKRT